LLNVIPDTIGFIPPQQRQWTLGATARNNRHYQISNAQSRRSRRKKTIRKLHRIGVTLRSLRRCRSG